MKLLGLGTIEATDLRFEEPLTLVEVFELMEMPKTVIVAMSKIPTPQFGTFAEVLKFIRENPKRFAVLKNVGLGDK